MKTLYSVRGWESQFENSQSRKCTRLAWVPIPNKHDGKSYRRLIELPNGPAIYAAWILILQVASKCPKRGVLADDDGPLDADDLAAKTGCPAEHFVTAFEVLSSTRIGWLESDSVKSTERKMGVRSQTTPSVLPDHATVSSQKGIEQKRKEKERDSASADSAADLDEFVKVWNESGLTQCRKLTGKRRKALQSRLADADWKASWREALAKAAKSSFCCGGSERGWKADIDWFLKPDSAVKLLEGKYDDQKPRTGQRTPDNPEDVMAKHTADVLAEKRAEQESRKAAQNGGASNV